jgi:hypothetical protein
VLGRDWQGVNIIKPSKVYTRPDIMTLVEVEKLIGATCKLRYRLFCLPPISWDFIQKRWPRFIIWYQIPACSMCNGFDINRSSILHQPRSTADLILFF